jgi:hypothetical protein
MYSENGRCYWSANARLFDRSGDTRIAGIKSHPGITTSLDVHESRPQDSTEDQLNWMSNNLGALEHVVRQATVVRIASRPILRASPKFEPRWIIITSNPLLIRSRAISELSTAAWHPRGEI